MVAGVWGVGVGVVGFLVVPGLVVRRGREFSPAGSTRNPLRRPAPFPGWEGAWSFARRGVRASRFGAPPRTFPCGDGGGCVVGWGWGCGVFRGAGVGGSSGSGV